LIYEFIDTYRKRIKRAGEDFLSNIFYNHKGTYGSGNILSAQDCLKIFNTLGITIEIIYLLAVANGLNDVDEEGFINLLINQDERLRNTMLTSANDFPDQMEIPF